MSGKKISEMTAITGAQLDQVNDVLPVLDVSDTTNPNKKISIQELADALGAGTINVDLSLDGSNNLTLTDSDNNTVTVDLSALDNTGLTLADVTANGAVTTDEIFIGIQDLTTNRKFNVESSFGTPAVKLLRRGSFGPILEFGRTGQAFISIGQPADNSMSFANSTGNILYLASGGLAVSGSSSATSPSATLDIQGTDAVQLTAGTTAQRPITPANGMIRYNSDDDVFEGYAGGNWGKTSGLTLADVTANGAVTGDVVTFNNVASFSQRLECKNEIRILTGTTVIGKMLNVSGSLNIQGDGSRDISFGSATVNNAVFVEGTNGKVGLSTSPTVTLDINGTDAVQLTSGTTAERPTAAAGMIRFNTTTSKFEGYDGTAWIDLN